MTGFALQQFLKIHADRGNHKDVFEDIPWPFLNLLVSKRRLNFVDYALAERILRPSLQNNEEVAALICYLSLASRQGHLCIKIEDKQIFPHPIQLFQETFSQDDPFDGVIDEHEIEIFSLKLLNGALHLPDAIVSQVDQSHSSSVMLKPICQWKNYFYLQRYWVEESLFLQHFERLINSSPDLRMDVNVKVQDLLLHQHVLAEQAEAILRVMNHTLSILSGGPGTGKTYTAGRMIQVFWESMDSEQQQSVEILLTAPTGKAAANLQQSLNRFTSHLQNFKPLIAQTLHAALEIYPDARKQQKILTADIIIVDESSMIDVRLMAKLFASIKKGARLILLGDRYQLPPVEAGSIFADMIHFCEEKPLHIVTELTTCLRAELKEIVDFSNQIQQQNTMGAAEILSKSAQGVKRANFSFFAQKELQVAQSAIVENAGAFYNNLLHDSFSVEHMLASLKSFCLLTPLRKGPFGVEALNHLIFQFLIKKQMNAKASVFIPIMIMRNDYKRELFNGDIGLLVLKSRGFWKSSAGYIDVSFTEEDYAIFPPKEKTSESVCRQIPALLLPSYEYAYCMSVYKSQGSEFEHVFLILPEGSELFGREMLYTAATRAKQCLEIWTSNTMLKSLIERKNQRLSGIFARLQSEKFHS